MMELMPAKDVQFIANLLLEIESQLDVNAIQVDGVHLWPLARLYLGHKFKRSDVLADAGLADGAMPAMEEAAPDVSGDGFPRSAAERHDLKFARRAELAGSVDVARRLLDDQWRRLREIGSADFLILSKIEKYYQAIGDRRYAPILDPVLEDLGVRGRAQMVALEPLDLACVNEPLRVDIEPHMIATAGLAPTDNKNVVRQLKELNRVVDSIAPDFAVPPKRILRRFDRLRKRMPFFRTVLEILQPRALFMSSFTGWLPAVWAARELGIPVVDIQHGGQQAIHHPTTHYGQVPRNGYAFLPDYFWVWGERNRRYIAQWLPGGAVRHVPIVGGNRNVAKWYRDRDGGRLADADRAFLERFGGQRGLVLVTLSYAVDRLLPDIVTEAIQKSPELTWLIRLHPIHRNTATRDQIVGLLRGLGCENFHVDLPTDVRLHSILSICQHHVTPFSTSGREATAFGVPTTICHPIGAKVFHDEITEGLYDYAPDSERLLQNICGGMRSWEPDSAKRREAIETSDEAVDALLARVLSDSQPACCGLGEHAGGAGGAGCGPGMTSPSC